MKTLDDVYNRIQSKAFNLFKAWRWKLKPKSSKTETERQTVFVAGNQRSGTNMVMNILDKSFATDVYHERDPRAFEHYLMREQPVIRRLRANSPSGTFVIKALCESQYLLKLFEDYSSPRGVWVYRNYSDVVKSMVRSFSGMAGQAKKIADNPESAGWLGQGMSQQTHQLVKRVVNDSIDDASASALQWYYRNVLFFDQHFDADERVILLKYEDLVTLPEQGFKRLFEFLGVPFKEKFVKNIFSTSVNKKTSVEIQPEIAEICTGLMERLDTVYANQKKF
jgi:hypothetical protein